MVAFLIRLSVGDAGRRLSHMFGVYHEKKSQVNDSIRLMFKFVANLPVQMCFVKRFSAHFLREHQDRVLHG